MSRFLRVCLLVPVVLSGCQGANNSPVVEVGKPASLSTDPQTRLSIARVREQEGKLSTAASILKELCESDPKNAEYAHRYGIVLSRLGDFKDGVKWLAQADALKPDTPEILSDLGFACLMTGRASQAVQVLLVALELDPQNTRAVNNLGLAHGYLGEYDKAHEMFLRTMTEAEAMSNLGYVATQAGNKDFAIQCYSRALDLNPDLTNAKEALVQLAELDQRLAERNSIAQASRQPSDVVQAAGNEGRDKTVIEQAAGQRDPASTQK